MTLEMDLLYVHALHMGYGRMGVNLAAQLKKQGVAINDHLMGTEDATPARGNSKDFLLGKTGGRSNVVCWAAAPSHAAGWWKGQTVCLLTMWESTRLPEGFRDALDNFETVMVPSMQNVELFSRYHPNVKYVPLGVDPDVWQYRERQTPDRYFRYLIGGRGKRKGTDLAVKAFSEVRNWWEAMGRPAPEPRLLMKNPRSEEFWRGDGSIEMISGRISQAEEVELYASAHCYLQPSRGEGFGLQPLQAIAQGCPTILTDAHGHGSFAHLGWPLSTTFSDSDYFIYGDAGKWWEPDLDELIFHMKSIYEDYETAVAFAKLSSSMALREFTWENTANRFLDAIGRDKLGPYVGPEEWIEPAVRLYPLVTNRDMACDIGGTSYEFKKGVEYWQLSDVKRVLFESGDLDTSCLLDEDPKNTGLHQSQIDKLRLTQSGQTLCPTCGGIMP